MLFSLSLPSTTFNHFIVFWFIIYEIVYNGQVLCTEKVPAFVVCADFMHTMFVSISVLCVLFVQLTPKLSLKIINKMKSRQKRKKKQKQKNLNFKMKNIDFLLFLLSFRRFRWFLMIRIVCKRVWF